MEYENILVRSEQGIGIVQFNRPKALNALNREMMAETMDALEQFDADPEIGCLLVTGQNLFRRLLRPQILLRRMPVLLLRLC